jgi:hypothetical protein
MAPIRVKTSRISNLYVVIIYAPHSKKKVVARRMKRSPFDAIAVGEVIRAGRQQLLVQAVERRDERREGRIEHVTEVFTRAVSRRRSRRRSGDSNVVRMPSGEASLVAQFIRYHVLVRVYDGDADAWLADLESQSCDGDDGAGDVRFVRWIRSRLRHDPALLGAIRRMVEATPFWRAAEA